MAKNTTFSCAILIVTAALVACSRHEQSKTHGPSDTNQSAQAGAPAQSTSAPAVAAQAPQPQAQLPSATPPAPGASAGEAFDINKVAVSTAQLPEFPYIGWPEALPSNYRWVKRQDFDQAWFIVGKQVKAVEGKVEQHQFSNSHAQLSRLAADRNLDLVLDGLKKLGAVQVNAVGPDSPEIGNLGIKNLNDKLYRDSDSSYKSFLIRTPEKNVWISVAVSDNYTNIMAVDEQSMKQSVRLTSNGDLVPAAH